LRHRALFDRPHRFARDAVEHVQQVLLARDGDDLDRFSVHHDIAEERRRRDVEIPKRMMHELEVPLPHAGLQVDRDERLGKQIVAGTVPAVVVRCRRLDWEIYEAELLVDTDLRPHAHIAVDRPRVVFPGLVAVFARTRNRVEAPE
jgi:hypothetical protein